jgi:tRNA-splicing ligase RtcB (3'-phosphate/5'-hydroxy nucleic acid ligase)
MRVIFDAPQRVAIHSWTDRIDAISLARLRILARWEGLAGPIAVMPDIHPAEDVCVGTILATRDAVLPTAIGLDLGCGMSSQRFEFAANELTRADLERIVTKIMCRVPVGRKAHHAPKNLPARLSRAELSTGSLVHQKEWLGARHFGTLGGGNHFIELQADAGGRLWCTVHSGSRGVGAAIAMHHARIAAREPKGGPLPWLERKSESAAAFLNDLDVALAFAAENRREMLQQVEAILRKYIGGIEGTIQFDVAHNTITREIHGGDELLIHRKGAMPARAGQCGIIPGSMGTASYIVEGLGHAASYESCSHGAGRKLSRTEARQRISLGEFSRQMAHVVLPPRCNPRSLLEEAPSAYKDIKEVLEQQTELVRKVVRLMPLAVVKG